jgi:hypothetical protein
VEGSCKRGDEPPGSIKCWEVLELLHNKQLLKKGSAPWVSEWVSSYRTHFVFCPCDALTEISTPYTLYHTQESKFPRGTEVFPSIFLFSCYIIADCLPAFSKMSEGAILKIHEPGLLLLFIVALRFPVSFPILLLPSSLRNLFPLGKYMAVVL